MVHNVPLPGTMILEFCQWLQNLGWATALRESQYMFPIVEGIHLLGIAFILGPVLMLDFRLAGLAWTDQPVSKIARTFVPFSIWGAVVSFLTGILLFCSEAERCYDSPWFRVKVILLAAAGANALYFHLRTQAGWGAWETQAIPPARARMAGFASIVLWAGVLFAGRWTAYNL